MFITCQLGALEDSVVFEVMWEVADLVWKARSRSRVLQKVSEARGVDAGKSSERACTLS